VTTPPTPLPSGPPRPSLPPPPGLSYPPPPQPGYGHPPPPPVAPGGQRLAEFTDRLVAYIIDGAILGGVTAVVVIPIYLCAVFAIFDDLRATVVVNQDPYGGGATAEMTNPFAYFLPLLGVMAVLILLSLLFAYLYTVEMMFRSGQTVGKRVMKIQVIPIDPAVTLTRWLAFKRFLVQHVAAAFVPAGGLIDGLWQLWDKPYRQCLHDKFAMTVVIKLDP